LKAIRYSLFREVAFAGDVISGPKLTALADFVNLLANHYPTARTDERQLVGDAVVGNVRLNGSRGEQAKAVFGDLSDWLIAQGTDARLSISDWQNEFMAAERRHGSPFPVTAKWQHCRGSSDKFRGFTCGIWTSLHALTVRVYLDNVADNNFTALPVLKTIRNWVDHFFSCRECRGHFILLTTKLYSMESKAKQPHDVFMYMWKVHNTVNARLKGSDTEDPQYPKYQFPAPFLCPQCSKDGIFDEYQVRQFLLRYYTDVKRDGVFAQETLKFL
uniref:Sulfhydryl oxidase n=1 Tax=Plectus sambesii TaxID=2011161 RepID=A0A914UPN3_9BILA